MYSGMADVAALTGDAAYLKASDAIWQDVVGKKLYITGGIGATGSGEAFGGDYELPNMTAYNETCAVDRQRLLEPPAVPAARRREVHRRDGAHALQRPDLRRVARRQVVLLPEPARVRSASTRAAPGSASPAARRTSRASSPRCPGYVYARQGHDALRQPLRGGHGHDRRAGPGRHAREDRRRTRSTRGTAP